MLNGPFLENTAKDDSSPLQVQKGATKSCPPRMWVCDEVIEN